MRWVIFFVSGLFEVGVLESVVAVELGDVVVEGVALVNDGVVDP